MIRLLENGANTSFVNRIADPAVPVESVVVDPVALARSHAAKPNPRIALPAAIYGDRRNSAGFAFADDSESAPFLAALQPLLSRNDWAAAPLVAGKARSGARIEIRDPSHGRAIGEVLHAEGDAVEDALAIASGAKLPAAEERAASLDRAADAIEAHRVELIALLAREAGKTLPDALGEVREAADFCRYYALLARKHFAAPEV
ncbi:MAG: aldehyde dehydrogenase family protein, partial [Planctomycetales bacterium]